MKFEMLRELVGNQKNWGPCTPGLPVSVDDDDSDNSDIFIGSGRSKQIQENE